MNTRVQVEHCVTEMTTGIDIVKEGIRAAAGEELPTPRRTSCCAATRSSAASTPRTPRRTSPPRPGKIGAYREPTGPGVRVDSGVRAGGEVSPMYDPMVAKLIVWDADREQATERMLRALGEYEIEGAEDADPVPPGAARDRAVGQAARPAATCSRTSKWLKTLAFARRRRRRGRRGRGARSVEQTYTVEVSGKRFDVRVLGPPFAGGAGAARRQRRAPRRRRARAAGAASASPRGGGGGADTLPSPLQGNMWKVLVKQGDTVEEGQLLCIIEAMKMENEITAHKAGTIVELPITEGARDPGGRADRDDQERRRVAARLELRDVLAMGPSLRRPRAGRPAARPRRPARRARCR